MSIEKQIEAYFNSLDEHKQKEMKQLHSLILNLSDGQKLWYLDGKDELGKVVSNPNVGYGVHNISYKDGSIKEFYKVGISANQTGISVYIMTIADKAYLKNQYADRIGKATVTGYCIKFKKIENISLEVLEQAVIDGLN